MGYLVVETCAVAVTVAYAKFNIDFGVRRLRTAYQVVLAAIVGNNEAKVLMDRQKRGAVKFEFGIVNTAAVLLSSFLTDFGFVKEVDFGNLCKDRHHSSTDAVKVNAALQFFTVNPAYAIDSG